MKKSRRLMIILLINLFIFMPRIIVKAEEEKSFKIETNCEDEKKDSKEVLDIVNNETNNGLDTLYNYINKMKTDVELMNNLDPVEYIKSYMESGKGNVSFDKLLRAVLSLVFKEVNSVLKIAVSLIVIAILCALLKNLQNAFSNENISKIAFYACYSVLILMLSKSFLISLSVAKDVIYGISDFMAAILPILVTIIGVAGGFVQAATLDPIVTAAVVLIPNIYSTLIIPLVLVTFVLQFANNLSEEHKIDNLCKMFKQSTIWLQGIIITIFIALLTIRGITSSTLDAVTLKTTKFAIDNFVPIVGKALSDAITSVAGYSLVIKNAISGIGLFIIILIIIYPVIKIVLMTFIYKLSAALVEPISDKRITSAIVSTADSLVILLSCVLSISLMFFVLIAIMASAGKFVIGG